jgi:hypothetical protein
MALGCEGSPRRLIPTYTIQAPSIEKISMSLSTLLPKNRPRLTDATRATHIFRPRPIRASSSHVNVPSLHCHHHQHRWYAPTIPLDRAVGHLSAWRGSTHKFLPLIFHQSSAWLLTRWQGEMPMLGFGTVSSWLASRLLANALALRPRAQFTR